MELLGEDGSVVELSETLKKEFGRGPGVAPHDRSVSRRQVRLHVERLTDHDVVVIEVLGSNPICVVHARVGDVQVEIVKPGTQCALKLGDKFSPSIQEPVFFTLSSRRLHGTVVEADLRGVAEDEEEEGIAEAVARWQRRKQERLQSDQQARDGSQRELVHSRALSPAVDDHEHEHEQVDRLTTTDDTVDAVSKYGFIVENHEFERYGKKALDTRKWDWRIGKPGSNNDEDEEEEEGGGRQQQQQHRRTTAGSRTSQKANLNYEDDDDDDDDDWRGDSDGEKELLSRKRPAPRTKEVEMRSHNMATTSGTIDPRMKRKLVSTSDLGNRSIEQGRTKLSKQAIASTSTRRISKRQPRASEDDEEEEDNDREDLEGFLVDDIEEDGEEIADEEDEWTDEEEEVEEDNDVTEDPVGNRAPGRPVLDKGDGSDDVPVCKYGSKCFRKNKDHLAQFRH